MIELSLHILDLAQNAIEAGASRIEISIEEDLKADLLLIEIRDNGRGMTEEQTTRVLDPFYTTRETRHIGLGLPLLAEASRHCGGGLEIDSTPGAGTVIRARFRHSHIDRAPLGDIPSVLLAVLLSEKPIDWRYLHTINGRIFQLDSSEIRKAILDIPLTHPLIRQWLLDGLSEGENSLREEVLPRKATA